MATRHCRGVRVLSLKGLPLWGSAAWRSGSPGVRRAKSRDTPRWGRTCRCETPEEFQNMYIYITQYTHAYLMNIIMLSWTTVLTYFIAFIAVYFKWIWDFSALKMITCSLINSAKMILFWGQYVQRLDYFCAVSSRNDFHRQRTCMYTLCFCVCALCSVTMDTEASAPHRGRGAGASWDAGSRHALGFRPKVLTGVGALTCAGAEHLASRTLCWNRRQQQVRGQK